MWNNKLKAITFSFDDGVKQDIRLIKLLNKYNLKATFNLNSGKLGTLGTIPYANGTKICRHDKVSPQDVKSIYEKHEVAVHTLTHPLLTQLDNESIAYQIETDRKILSDLCGYEVVGMAYPGGAPNNDERVQKIIKEKTGIKYARSFPSTFGFELPQNLFELEGSVYFLYTEKLFELGKRFIDFKSNKPQLFYIWGHSYELDQDKITWEILEDFFRLISNKNDIFYGTNREILLNE